MLCRIVPPLKFAVKPSNRSRPRLKRDGTRAETRFSLSAKRTSLVKLAGEGSGQSNTSSRGVRISSSNGSNAGYTMFRCRVQDYWLPTALACFPFTSPTVRHRVPSGFNWALPVWEDMSPSVNPTIHTHCTPTPYHYWRYDNLETSLTNLKKVMVDILCTILKYNLALGLVTSQNLDDNLPWQETRNSIQVRFDRGGLRNLVVYMVHAPLSTGWGLHL